VIDALVSTEEINLEASELREAFTSMLTIRRVEERLLQLFAQGKITGTVHTCIGQEVSAVGVISALRKKTDVVWSNHRGHGHYLAYTDNVDALIAEIMGKRTGICKGVGGSQHLQQDGFYSNGILGGTAASAVGSAFAERALGRDSVTVVFLGDGAMGEGIVTESMNMAALWKLPVIFVVENNGIAQTTPTELEHAGDIAKRAETFGIRSWEMRADDVLRVGSIMTDLAAATRRGEGPAYLMLHTYRLSSHSKGDDTRTPEHIESLKAADPLMALYAAFKRFDPAWLQALESALNTRIDRAVASADASSPLTVDELPRVAR
jgi:TPP-dependent pyruvate/acetoin dehydrogenase alpha subunit